MPRLIDAEKALDNLEEMTWYHLNNDGKLVEGSRSDFISFINYSDAKRSIEDSATVDAVPVRHGHWVEDGYYGLPNVCSWCGEENKEMAKYCPHCGALMDEKVQDEN